MKSYKRQKNNEVPRKITEKLLRKIGIDYQNEFSTYQISHKYKITVQRVIGALKKLKIPLRSRGESIKLAHSQGRMRKNKKSSVRSEWGSYRVVGSNGYIFIWMPEHPSAINGYVREHLLVWEKHHDKKLPPKWHIHHINGVKSDNRPENLLALSAKDHANFIPKLYEKIKELEEERDFYKDNSSCRNLFI